jgi:hypothetical protein
MAAKKVVIEGSSVTASQLKDFFRQIDDGSINGGYLQMFLEHKFGYSESGKISWPLVYQTLGLPFDESLVVEADPNHWDVYVMKGVTLNMVVRVFCKLGVGVYIYMNDLDRDVPANDRDPKNGSYRVSFKKTVEADPELANRSAEDLKGSGIQGITLLERLLLELGYFLATKEHLDQENITLCSGSRNSDGAVPGVNWLRDSRKLYVLWYDPRHADDYLRARAIVSLSALAE